MTTRVTQACQRCQRRKLRCSGQPQCSACSAARQPCVYGHVTRRRGLAEGYVRGLERLLGFAITRDASLAADIDKLASSNEVADLSDTSDIKQQHETMHEAWKESSVSRDFEQLLPVLEKAETKRWQSCFTNRETASSTKLSPSNIDFSGARPFSPHGSATAGLFALESNASRTEPSPNETTLDQGGLGEAPAMEPGSATPPTHHSLHKDETLLPENAKQMIDEYLAYTNCWFPILERHELLRTFHQCRAAQSSNGKCTISRSYLSVLWAVIAFEMCKHSAATASESLDHISAYRCARRHIPTEEEESHDLSYVQALLILTLINLGYGLRKPAYLLNGYALRLLQCAEEDWSSDNAAISPALMETQHGRKQHISAGCLILEKLLSLQLGRRLSADPFLQQTFAVPEDGLEEWDTPIYPGAGEGSGSDKPARVLSIFNSLTRGVDTIFRLYRNQSKGHTTTPLPNLDFQLSERKEALSNSYQMFVDCCYPQYLTNYLVHLWNLLVQTKHDIPASEGRPVDAQLSTSAVVVDLLTTLSSAFDKFIQMHGLSRVPVVACLMLDRILHDLVALRRTLPAWQNPGMETGFQELKTSLRSLGAFWPAFNRAHNTVSQDFNMIPGQLELSGAKTDLLSGPHPYLQPAGHILEQQPCSPGNLSYNLPTPTGPSLMMFTSNDVDMGLEVAGTGAGDTALGSTTNISQEDDANNVFSSRNGDDVYFQLAEADLLHWSGEMQETGLRELGFDKSAFEEWYNGQD